jgi:hypothetical protein
VPNYTAVHCCEQPDVPDSVRLELVTRGSGSTRRTCSARTDSTWAIPNVTASRIESALSNAVPHTHAVDRAEGRVVAASVVEVVDDLVRIQVAVDDQG